MNHEAGQPLLAATAQQKILAYLGELKQGDSVTQMRLAADLDIPHQTLAAHVRLLVELGYVVTMPSPNGKLVFISPNISPATSLKIIIEWDDAFGSHPYNGRLVRRQMIGHSNSSEVDGE